MKKSRGLSPRQQDILRYMDRYMGEHGYPPTIREIGAATHINSTSVVNYNLNKLAQAGYIERRDRVSRGMRLTKWRSAADSLLRRCREAFRRGLPACWAGRPAARRRQLAPRTLPSAPVGLEAVCSRCGPGACRRVGSTARCRGTDVCRRRRLGPRDGHRVAPRYGRPGTLGHVHGERQRPGRFHVRRPVAPAHNSGVGPDPTRMPATGGDSVEPSRRRSRLAMKVRTPAHHPAVRPHTARMPGPGRDRREPARRRVQQAVPRIVPTPAHHRRIVPQPARMPGPGRDRRERTRRRVGVPIMVVAPAHHRPIGPDPTRMPEPDSDCRELT